MPILQTLYVPKSGFIKSIYDNAVAISLVSPRYVDRNVVVAYQKTSNVIDRVAAIDPEITGVANGTVELTERVQVSRAGTVHFNIKFKNLEPLVSVIEGPLGKVARNTTSENTLSVTSSASAKLLRDDPASALALVKQQAHELIKLASAWEKDGLAILQDAIATRA